MKDQELIDLLKQQAKEIADANIAGWGNTMTEAANRLEQLVMPKFENMAKAVIRRYRLMDDMCSPYFQDWHRIEEDEVYEVKHLAELLKEFSA